MRLPTTFKGWLLVLGVAVFVGVSAAAVARYGFGLGQPEQVASVSDDEGSKDKDATAKDKDTTAKDKDTTAKDKDTTAKDKDTTAKDKDTTAKDKDTTAKDKDAALKDTTTKKDAPEKKDASKDKDTPKDKEVPKKEPVKKLTPLETLTKEADDAIKGKEGGRFTVEVPRGVSDAELDRLCARFKNQGWNATKGAGAEPGQRFLILKK